MKKMRLIAVAFLCLMSLCVSAMAQLPGMAQTPAELPPPLPEEMRATTGQIATLLDTMRIRDQMNAVLDLMPMVMQQQLQQQREALNSRQLTPEQDERINNFLRQRIEKSMDLYPIEDIIADAGTVYQKYITREDADVLIAFYKTPAAQRLIYVQPAIAQEYLPLILSRMETRVKAFAEETAREAQELLKELSKN